MNEPYEYSNFSTHPKHNSTWFYHKIYSKWYMDVGLRKVPWAQISDRRGRRPLTTAGVRKLD